MRWRIQKDLIKIKKHVIENKQAFHCDICKQSILLSDEINLHHKKLTFMQIVKKYKKMKKRNPPELVLSWRDFHNQNAVIVPVHIECHKGIHRKKQKKHYNNIYTKS